VKVFQKIIEKNESVFSGELAKSLNEKFDLEDHEDLSILIRLAYTQYVLDEKEIASQLSSLISDIKFTGNHDIWTWVKSALVLRSYIYNEKGQSELSKNCIEKINFALSKDKPINQKAFQRVLNGSLLNYDKIENAKDENAEYGWRLVQLQKLILIHEMGGGDEFSVERAEKEIQENIERLKTLINEFNQTLR